MELQQLRYFQTVARLEHISKAAEELHISQPSLSITIARLEESIGVPLFDRQHKKISLNFFGKKFLKTVNQILSDLEESKREINDLAGLDYGTISVASTNLSLVTNFINLFLKQFPHLKFHLQQDTTQMMQQQLEKSNIDFCISSPLIEGQGICSTPLMEEEIIIAVPFHHKLASKNSIDLNELASESFISLKKGYGIRDLTDSFCEQAGFNPNITFEVNDPSLVENLVHCGLGVAFVPLNAWGASANASSHKLSINKPVCKRTIGISWKESRYLSVAAQRFRDSLIEYFKHQASS